MKKTSEKSETFVNRHGHRKGLSGINQDELAELSIDEQVDEPIESVVEPVKKAKKSRVRRPGRKIRFEWTRRKLIILLTIIAVLIVVPVITGEVLRSQYLQSSNNGQSALKALIASEVLPQQKKTSLKAKELTVTIAKIETIRDDVCPGGLLDNMASLYPRAKSAYDACIAERSHIATLATHLRDLEKDLSYSEQVSAVLAQVTAPTTDAYAVIGTQLSNWKSVQSAISAINPPTDVVAIHKKLTAAVEQISDGWSKLNTANNDKKADGFTAAEKQLSEAYGNVRDMRNDFMAFVAAKQAVITQLSRQL